ncbi:MAG: MAPEG family protein [Rhodospirillaceae bacterium]|nr:MAPEG family protein [Rhodospirillaceae bacterium]
MTGDAIFGPVFAMMTLTLAVWIYMYIRRISFISGQSINPRDLEVPGELARLSPAAVSNPSDNLKNLFELPVLFYAVALYLFVTGRVDAVDVAAAWVFVAFRALHSLVHCTFNRVLVRFSLYIASSLALWAIVLRAAGRHFGLI